MKILLTHRYFWPDTAPYALMLRAIGEGLADAGHEICVFASKPSYREGQTAAVSREKLGRLAVRRCWVLRENRKNPALRVANVFLYCAALFVHILRLRPDAVTASTFPPVIAAWTASFAAGLIGAKFIYHIQDIHPEVSQYSGGFLGRRLPARFLRWLDNQTLRRADTIVTLSQDMQETLQARGLGPLPLKIINNLPLDAFEEASAPPAELRKAPGTSRVIFAGNLGRFQNLPLLAEGIAQCFSSHPDLELFFLGDGAALPDLKARWGAHPQVRFAPFLPFSEARALIKEADIGLVSLAPNIYRVAYPSKVSTYRDLNLRVLALVEPDSRLALDLVQSGQGAVPNTQTPDAIQNALERVIDMAVPKADPKANQSAKHAAWAEIFAS
ncbi:MAG: glycosyltransferase family 4 protein [Paracoccaceae bacterium]